MVAGHLKRAAGGHLHRESGGHLANVCPPCSVCTGNQNDIVITGNGTGACDVAGTYSFSAFTDTTYGCTWSWTVGLGALELVYCEATKTYCAYLTLGYGADANTCNTNCASDINPFGLQATDIGNPLTCTAGQLTGNFALAGDGACGAFSVSISLNGG